MERLRRAYLSITTRLRRPRVIMGARNHTRIVDVDFNLVYGRVIAAISNCTILGEFEAEGVVVWHTNF